MVDGYDLVRHHPLAVERSPSSFDLFAAQDFGSLAVERFGATTVARRWYSNIADGVSRSKASGSALTPMDRVMKLFWTHHSTRAVTAVAAEALRLFRVLGYTFDELRSTAHVEIKKVATAFAWNVDASGAGSISYAQFGSWANSGMMTVFLLSPKVCSVEHVLELLGVPGSVHLSSSAKHSESYDITHGWNWSHLGGDSEPFCYLELGQYEDAIAAASISVQRFPLNASMRNACKLATGKAHAAAGRPEEARVSFDATVEDASQSRCYFLATLATLDKLALSVTRGDPSPGSGGSTAERDDALAGLGRFLQHMGASSSSENAADYATLFAPAHTTVEATLDAAATH
jgi:hypothetical protein